MADTVKKPKAPAKPRATAAKKKVAAPEPVAVVTPSHHEIADLARQYWAQRGYTDGYAEQDWIRAEQELMQKAS